MALATNMRYEWVLDIWGRQFRMFFEIIAQQQFMIHGQRFSSKIAQGTIGGVPTKNQQVPFLSLFTQCVLKTLLSCKIFDQTPKQLYSEFSITLEASSWVGSLAWQESRRVEWEFQPPYCS